VGVELAMEEVAVGCEEQVVKMSVADTEKIGHDTISRFV
jgi:hypothetical protein